MIMERNDINNLIKTFTELFRSVHQNSYVQMDRLKLYPGQPKLLAIIREYEGLTQKELAEKNCVKPATVTGMLNKLEANGYVYRLADESDKRVFRVYLTPEGREAAMLSTKLLLDLTERMFSGFTQEELKTFISLTDKIKSNLQKEEP